MVVVDEGGGGGLWWCGAEGQARLVLRRLAVLPVGGVEQIGGIGNSDGRGPVLNIYYILMDRHDTSKGRSEGREV